MEVETWDDDFDGGFNAFAGASVGTAHTSISSRLSVHSESVAGGDDDWNLVIDAADEKKTIQSAQQAGIPLPDNIPTSALLGGTIKRLGKKKSRQKLCDDWDNDMEMPDSGTLQLKPRAIEPPATAATFGEEHDDFDELEGSLGIRFAGRDAVNRSSSVSAMSPSLGSVTAESEDELRGLELPEGQVDFEAILIKKRRAADAELSDLSQPSPAIEQTETMNKHKKSKLVPDENDEYLNDFDLGTGGVLLDSRKRTLNKNIKIKTDKTTTTPPATRPTTIVNFHEKPTDKPMHIRSNIPRPVSGSKPAASRLQPVFEDGVASHVVRERRQLQHPTTTGAQLLRSKRSMPVLRSQQPTAASTQRQAPSFIPSPGQTNNNQSQIPPPHRPAAYHLRRESDPRRVGAQSPPLRSHSRLSNTNIPDTPSRSARQHQQRQDVAPASLAREAATKKTMTKPARKRNYGDGNELEIFDDLPTSSAKESKFVKQPVARGGPKATPTLRPSQSRGDIRGAGDQSKRNSAFLDRMVTPAPGGAPCTPASPTKGFYDSHTPSYLRDTAASRIARESRLSNASSSNTNAALGAAAGAAGHHHHHHPVRPTGPTGPGAPHKIESSGPLMPLSTNWKAQVAARSPHTSPSAQRHLKGSKDGVGKPRAQPQLIKGIGAHVVKNEKGMTYNPHTYRWEGNENTLQHFNIELPPPQPHPHHNHHNHQPLYQQQQQQPWLETPTPSSTNKAASSYMDSRHHPPPPPSFSPPRPALIAPMSAAGTQGVQVNGGMVFDPRLMKWLKLKEGRERDVSGPLSPSVTDAEGEEEEDAFAGIEDLKDEFSTTPAHGGYLVPGAGGAGVSGAGGGGGVSELGMASPVSLAAAGAGEIHEEFDLGPKFIETQVAEEAVWRRRCGVWFGGGGDDGVGGSGSGSGMLEARVDDGAWRWGIRDMVSSV